jgi:hypothetical protein
MMSESEPIKVPLEGLHRHDNGQLAVAILAEGHIALLGLRCSIIMTCMVHGKLAEFELDRECTQAWHAA